jgi:hypothetical protein
VGSRAQAREHGFRLAASTLAKIERLFHLEMDDAARATWSAALESAQNGAAGMGASPAALAEGLQQAATQLGTEISTAAPVDLVKLLFRLRSDVSFVAAADLGLSVATTRLVQDCRRGETTTADLVVQSTGSVGVTNLSATVLSPWGEVASRSTVPLGQSEILPGASLDLGAQLFVPAQPMRPLMPYLVVLTGQTQAPEATPFTIAVPVDLQTALPLSFSLDPPSAARGATTSLAVTVTNHLLDAGEITLTFGSRANAELVPPQSTVTVPAQGSATLNVDLVLSEAAAIGEFSLPFSIASSDARFVMEDTLWVSVTAP